MTNRFTMGLFLAVLLSFALSSFFPLQGEGEPEYEMTTYYVGFLYRGEAWSPEVTEESKKIQMEHLAHIQKMAESGDLLLAGPFTDDGDLRGMLVFQVASEEQAHALASEDPAVKAGRLRIEMHPWYSAKGIQIHQGDK